MPRPLLGGPRPAQRRRGGAGELPQGQKRGALSEDDAYDALAANRDLAVRMLEAATLAPKLG